LECIKLVNSIRAQHACCLVNGGVHLVDHVPCCPKGVTSQVRDGAQELRHWLCELRAERYTAKQNSSGTGRKTCIKMAWNHASCGPAVVGADDHVLKYRHGSIFDNVCMHCCRRIPALHATFGG
jgi:hypothetical protein